MIPDKAIEAAIKGYQIDFPNRSIPDRFREAISAYENAMWQEITEDCRPPLDVDLILGWWSCDAMAYPLWRTEIGLAGSERGGWLHGRATHFRPLPSPPKDSQ